MEEEWLELVLGMLTRFIGDPFKPGLASVAASAVLAEGLHSSFLQSSPRPAAVACFQESHQVLKITGE